MEDEADNALTQSINNLITDFDTQIKLLNRAHYAVNESRKNSDKVAAIGHLERVIEELEATGEKCLELPIRYINLQIGLLKLSTKEKYIGAPICHIRLQIALLQIGQGDQKECKKLLDDVESKLSMTDDPSVHAAYYWASSQYHRSCLDYTELYKSSILYLAYTSVESLSDSFKLNLAFDLSLSALLGDNIYNFGELLAHPIIKTLIGTNVDWLYRILQAFNSGDVVGYQELCRVHNAALRAHPILFLNEKRLLEKINFLCLMEIISSRPSDARTIPLSVIADRTKLSIEDVEDLIVKSISVGLIKGIINQEEGTVQITWVKPRVLGISQIKSLRDKLDNWIGKVQATLLSTEAETSDLIGS